jgi:hypothetical protein
VRAVNIPHANVLDLLLFSFLHQENAKFPTNLSSLASFFNYIEILFTMGGNFLKRKQREDNELAFLDTLYTNDSGSSKPEGNFYLVDM